MAVVFEYYERVSSVPIFSTTVFFASFSAEKDIEIILLHEKGGIAYVEKSKPESVRQAVRGGLHRVHDGGQPVQPVFLPEPAAGLQLFLHYAEMTDPDVEDGVLSALGRLGQNFLDGLSDLNCEVSFRKEGDDFMLLFETGGFGDLEARIDRKGKCRIIPVKG